MADLIGSLITVVEAVQTAIVLYKRIDGLPAQMTQLGRRIERLSPFLTRLEAFIKRRPAAASSSLYSGQKQDLKTLLNGINGHIKKATDLFERCEKGILSRSHDLEFRARWISQLWFSLVENSPEKVQKILDDIEYDRGVLSDYLALMAVDKPPDDPSPSPGLVPKPNTNSGPGNIQNTTTQTNRKLSPSPTPAKRPSPSPSPMPRQDFKVLFVDPYHDDRTAIAESLLALFRELTLLSKSKTPWRISTISSAGFFVKSSSDLVPVISSLNYSYPSWKMDFKLGGPGVVPKPEALKAVFDNNWANYPFKNTIKSQISSRTSVGLTRDVFQKHDYIFVFTKRDHDNMVKLKEAVSAITKERQKARVLHLGMYLGKEIFYPKLVNGKGAKEEVEKTNRHEWNKKVAEIKTALKEFLRQEMRWQMPELPDLGKNDEKKAKDVGKKDANGGKEKKKEGGKDKVNENSKGKGKG